MTSPHLIAALQQLHSVCSHSLNHPYVMLHFAAASLVTVMELAAVGGDQVHEFLATTIRDIDTARARALRESTTARSDEARVLAAEQAVTHLRSRVLTALGILDGKVVLLPSRQATTRSPPPEVP